MTASNVTGGPSAAAAVPRARPTIAYVTAQELASVPKATSSRITLTALNEAVEAIQNVIDAKARILGSAKGKLSTKERDLLALYRSQRTEDHGKAFFVQEQDVASVIALGSGKGKSIVRTLRFVGGCRSFGLVACWTLNSPNPLLSHVAQHPFLGSSAGT